MAPARHAPSRRRPAARHARPALWLALSASLLVSSACGWSRPTVGVLGDSITAYDQADLDQQLGGDYRLTISGNPGKTVEEVLPEAKVVATSKPRQVIIELGTNDVLRGVATDRSMVALSEMVGLFPSASCIHLVNVNEHMVDQATGRSMSRPAQRFNEALRTLASGDPRRSIIDWNATAGADLDARTPPSSTLTEDSIHPTAEGRRELNDLYRHALESC